MKVMKSLGAATALSLLGMSSAFAQTATSTVTINATVPKFCSITVSGGTNAQNTPDGSLSSVTLTPFTVSNGVPSGSATYSSAATCNSAATYSIAATPLTTSTASVSGFADKIGYTYSTGSVNLVVGSSPASVPATPTPAFVQPSTTITVGTPTRFEGATASQAPLLAGAYTGTVVVTLAPQ